MTPHPPDSQLFHRRADHEDNLHIARTNLFVNFNLFLAIAVGFADDRTFRIAFAVLALAINVPWALWAPNARQFIRALRDAGGDTEDEKLWKKEVGMKESIFRWVVDPLTLVSAYVPRLLIAGWLAILVYLLFRHS